MRKKLVKKDVLIAAIALISVFSVQLFFIIYGVMGYEYSGKEEGADYVVFNVAIFLVISLLFLLSFLKKSQIQNGEILIYLYIIFLVANHFFWVLFDNGDTPVAPDNLLFFFVLGISGFLALRVVYSYGAWVDLIKFAELLAIIMSIGIIISNVIPRLTGSLISGVGGTSYQAVSYYSAICFGILAVSTLRLDRNYRYEMFASNLSKLLNPILMMAMLVATISNGGRGAFIVVVLYSLLSFYWIASKRGLSAAGIFRLLALFFFVILMLWMVLKFVSQDSVLANGFARATQFLKLSDGLATDLAVGGSGRDVVYDVAIRGVADSPIFGYGAFAHWDKLISPHNLILDLMLQFGILVAPMIILGSLYILMRQFKRLSTERMWFFVIFLYPVVLLMFSGGYLRMSIFWFALAGILMSPGRKTNPS